VNAWRSGVDLVDALLEVAAGRRPAPPPPGPPGQRTHQTVLAVLGAAQTGRGRRGIAGELAAAAARHTGDYEDSVEEMTPWRGDRRATVPLVAAAAVTLVRPAWWQWFVSGSVAAYALTRRPGRRSRRTCISSTLGPDPARVSGRGP
jgi:hypothetical protein